MRARWLAGALLSAVAVTMAANDMTIAGRLAQWKTAVMPFHREGLSAREVRLVEKLAEASRYLDVIYWRQNDQAGYALYRTTSDAGLKRLLGIMGSRWDLIDGNRPFTGTDTMPPGRELYPRDLTAASLAAYLAEHPGDRAALYSPYTVVKRSGERLVGVPYRQEYREQLEPMAQALREAAGLADDAAFARFLRLRADALLTDDYFESDLAWMDLKDPKFDVIFAPYETYNDELLSVKTTYGAAVLIRNDAESRKLALYQRHVSELQEALPIAAAGRPSKRGHLTPMEVMDAPYRSGDLVRGYQAVADNLPNDRRIHEQKGSKKIFFKNFMDARVDYVILPLAQRLMEPAQAARVSAEGYMAGTILHEIAHGLGPTFALVKGKRVDINEAIGPAYSGLEEAKADVVGMFGLNWLAGRGVLSKQQMEENNASYVAGLLRSLRFGTGEAHGRAELMEFNYLLECRAVTFTGGRYHVDYERMPAAIAGLTKKLLAIEYAGDRAGAEAWFAKYGEVGKDLAGAVATTADIPVDIEPEFELGQ